ALGRVRIPKSAGVTGSPRPLSHPARPHGQHKTATTGRQRPQPAATRTVTISRPRDHPTGCAGFRPWTCPAAPRNLGSGASPNRACATEVAWGPPPFVGTQGKKV